MSQLGFSNASLNIWTELKLNLSILVKGVTTGQAKSPPRHLPE